MDGIGIGGGYHGNLDAHRHADIQLAQQAVMEVKLDTLSERVRQRNEVVTRTYKLEQDVAVAQNDIETLYRKVGSK